MEALPSSNLFNSNELISQTQTSYIQQQQQLQNSSKINSPLSKNYGKFATLIHKNNINNMHLRNTAKSYENYSSLRAAYVNRLAENAVIDSETTYSILTTATTMSTTDFSDDIFLLEKTTVFPLLQSNKLIHRNSKGREGTVGSIAPLSRDNSNRGNFIFFD